jgi:transposase
LAAWDSQKPSSPGVLCARKAGSSQMSSRWATTSLSRKTGVYSDYRHVHLDALSGLFVQVLRLCQMAGLVNLATVALDGTKIETKSSPKK